ncbi:MAG: type III pantothenate kinase [Pirellulaceae bacterium]|jgi:type III pantothenate kinase|nr:type III pantothenate kinase [Pirellulaceae bacterium]
MSGRPLIAVDIGNSVTKLGWFEEAAPTIAASAPTKNSIAKLPEPGRVREFPTGQSPPDDVLENLPAGPLTWNVASVQRDGQRVLARWVETHREDDEFRVLARGDFPLALRVKAPDRVGIDRLAAAVAANALREPGRPAIFVCAGTAVTVNLLASDGAFEGGAILAGFRMQAESLFTAADLLPLALLAPADEPPRVLGKNTEEAIRSGLFWGAVGAVREVIARMTSELAAQTPKSPSPQLFVTGGDLARLAPLVDQQARFVPQMVLAGIALVGFGGHGNQGDE